MLANKCDIYIASLWRSGHIVDTVNSLLNQDEIGSMHVICNSYTDDQWDYVISAVKSDKLFFYRGNNSKGSNEKVKLIGFGSSEFLGFADDDLIYDCNYLKYMIDGANKYKSFVSLHGSILKNRPVINYYQNRKVFRCLEDVLEDVEVDICGSGVSMVKRILLPNEELISLYQNMSKTSMDDLYLNGLLFKYGIRRIVLKHQKNFVKHKLQEPSDNYVFDRHNGIGKNCIEQTNYVNNIFD